MQRLRDVTFGEALDGLRPYLPFLGLAAVIALLLVALPAPSGDDAVNANVNADVTTPDASAGLAPTSPSGAGASTDGAVPGAPSGTAVLPSGGVGPAAPSAGGQEDGPATATSPKPSGTWPGIGSKAALAAPDCDPATGYLRLPSKIFNLPCVPLWPAGADNGGATASGVAADTIKVVVYYPEVDPATQAALTAAGVSDTDAQLDATLAGLHQL